MKLSELDYSYSENLVGLHPKPRSRVLWSEEGAAPMEMTWGALLNQFSSEDLLVVNDTKVIPCRVRGREGLDVTFLKPLGELKWQVLTPLRQWPKGTKESGGAPLNYKELELPGGIRARCIEAGRPQVVELNKPLPGSYFFEHGEMALPPYILKARGEKMARPEDVHSYQALFAEKPGSLAAPTASLHFKPQDIEHLRSRGVELAQTTLHVGLGTFLPVDVEDLKDHPMHEEWIEVSENLVSAVEKCRSRGGRVWALGTTVVRALESWSQKGEPRQGFSGWTDLLIQPGFEFKAVDRLLTNFHQPKSTLLALVMAFAGKDRVLEAYRWAMDREFHLFSYGDLSVWTPWTSPKKVSRDSVSKEPRLQKGRFP